MLEPNTSCCVKTYLTAWYDNNKFKRTTTIYPKVKTENFTHLFPASYVKYINKVLYVQSKPSSQSSFLVLIIMKISTSLTLGQQDADTPCHAKIIPHQSF